MTRKKIIIIGAGGHGRVVADCLIQNNSSSDITFLDDKYPKKESSGGFKIIGKISDLEMYKKNCYGVVVGIGDNGLRLELQNKAKDLGFSILTAIHPSSVIANNVKLGDGTVVFANSVINTGAIIGEGTIINSSSLVEHDNIIGNGCHIAPGVKLAGTVKVGDLTLVGIGAVVLQNIKISNDVIVGANSLVTKDVPKGSKVIGIPARQI